MVITDATWPCSYLSLNKSWCTGFFRGGSMPRPYLIVGRSYERCAWDAGDEPDRVEFVNPHAARDGFPATKPKRTTTAIVHLSPAKQVKRRANNLKSQIKCQAKKKIKKAAARAKADTTNFDSTGSSSSSWSDDEGRPSVAPGERRLGLGTVEGRAAYDAAYYRKRKAAGQDPGRIKRRYQKKTEQLPDDILSLDEIGEDSPEMWQAIVDSQNENVGEHGAKLLQSKNENVPCGV